MDDLAPHELGQQRLPLAALRVLGDFARERAVAGEECLRQVEQRLPQLVLDPGRATGVLDVLGGKRLAHALRLRVDEEDRLETRWRAPSRRRRRASPAARRPRSAPPAGRSAGSDASHRSADLTSASGSLSLLPSPNIGRSAVASRSDPQLSGRNRQVIDLWCTRVGAIASDRLAAWIDNLPAKRREGRVGQAWMIAQSDRAGQPRTAVCWHASCMVRGVLHRLACAAASSGSARTASLHRNRAKGHSLYLCSTGCDGDK